VPFHDELDLPASQKESVNRIDQAENENLCGCRLDFMAVFVSKISAQQQSKEHVNRQAPVVHMSGLLRLIETIPLPTEGYMDHLSYDLKN
jgi:hypothetical protein